MRNAVSWGFGNGSRLKERDSAMDKYRIALTLEERNALEQVVSVGKAAARRLTHARILLLADENQGDSCADTEIV